MPNVVRTDFVADAKQLFSTIDAVERRLKSSEAQIARFGQNPTFGGAVAVAPAKIIDAELIKANSLVERYRSDNLRAERELTRQLETEEKQRARTKIREAKLANDQAIREIKERERAERAALSGGRGFGQGVSDGLNIPIGAAAVGAIGGFAAISFGKSSLDATKEAANGQLQLQAVNKETGISYQNLTAQAQKFGEVNLLSNRAAQSTFAQIANFANAAGRGDKLEEFRQRFSDLAAAKGINASQLGDISRQLNALTDEATDKLLNANPSAFYDKFAKSINKTADSLTDAEKRAAIFDEVLRKGAIFDGSAAKRFDAATSATDKLAQKYENLKESAGKAILPVAELAEKAASSFLSIGGAQKNFNSNDAGAVAFNRSFLQDQRVAETVKSLRASEKLIADAVAAPLASSLNSELAKINIADSFFNLDNRQKLIDAARKTASATADSFKASFTAVLSDKNSSLRLLQLGQKQFYANQADYDPATRRELAESFENSIAERAKEDAEKAKAAREKAKAELEKRAEDVKKATEKIKELARAYVSAFDSLYQKSGSNNPFVSVFSEADKSLKDLRENLKGLSPELRAVAEQMQQKLNNDSLFNARLENDFARFDLRQNAEELRNFKPKGIEDANKFFEDFIADGLKQISQANGGSFTRYNLTGAGNSTFGFSQSDARNDLLNVYERLAGGGSISRRRTFQDLSEREKFDFLNRDNLSLQTRLGSAFDLAKNRTALTEEQQSLIDRKIISLAGGVRPEQLTESQRDILATANEKEAARREQSEARAQASRDAHTALLERVAASNERLTELAGKGGLAGIVRIIDETDGAVEIKRPNADDVARAYQDYQRAL